MQYLTIWDLVLTPLYLLILIGIAKRTREKKYPKTHPLHQYFLPGLYVKLAGAIFIAFIYQFYYGGGGDSFYFFYHAKIINSALDDSFVSWLKLLFRVPVDSDPTLYPYISNMQWYTDPPSYTIARIAAVLGLLNGTSYLPTALLFAFLSYSGIWAMYKTFAGIYPHLRKQLAYAFLFIPSTFVWGSAIYKDTVCMFALGWMTYTTFRIFVNKDLSIKNFIVLALSFFLIAIIKLYILLAFVPALLMWLLMANSHKIRSVALRWITNISFIGLTVAAFVFTANRFAEELNKYSLEKLVKTAETTRGWITYVSDIQEGSAYDLGPIDGTVGGLLEKFPAAVNVTLYRPYLWEAKKPIVLLSALEAFGFIIFTLLVFYKRGVLTTIRRIFSDPNLLFLLLYSVIFAFAVGVSTGNFGTLSRYKIPCMPFFAALLIILYYKDAIPSKRIIKYEASKQVRHIA